MKQIFAALAFVSIALTAVAQKQPQVQESSVRAPDNIKIDGKLNEWTNKNLQAYNSVNRMNYVISNDDNNLYITMFGAGTRVSRKSLDGGITITISHSVEKKTRTKAADNVAITFPVPPDKETAFAIMSNERALGQFLKDTVTNHKQIDSLEQLAGKQFNDALKEIKVKGVKEITDTLISVYNTEGIKARAGFDNIQPVYELAIPLKYLGLSVSNPVKFSYNIKMNGPPPDPAAGSDDDPDGIFLENPTDFWGEYILAKKP